MIILNNLSELPKNLAFRMVASKEIVECDYVYFHPTLKFYSCFFNVIEVD